MDAPRFDALTRDLTHGRSRRDLTQLLGGFVLAGPLALLGRAAPDAVVAKKNKNNKKKRKTLCHFGQTIKVAKSTVKAHLAHGDSLGPCPPPLANCPEGAPCTPLPSPPVSAGCGGTCRNGVCESICPPGSDCCARPSGTACVPPFPECATCQYPCPLLGGGHVCCNWATHTSCRPVENVGTECGDP
jgi:hypothetical protein